MEYGGVHAPSAMPDGKGGLFVIYNINAAKKTEGWDHLMSLARVLTLRADNTLGIEPIGAVESIRNDYKHVGETLLPANNEVVIGGIE